VSQPELEHLSTGRGWSVASIFAADASEPSGKKALSNRGACADAGVSISKVSVCATLARGGAQHDKEVFGRMGHSVFLDSGDCGGQELDKRPVVGLATVAAAPSRVGHAEEGGGGRFCTKSTAAWLRGQLQDTICAEASQKAPKLAHMYPNLSKSVKMYHNLQKSVPK
jgi:hypothetical protein